MFTLHNPTKVEDQSGYIVTSHPCPTCNETITLKVTPDKLYAYNQGAYAQDVLSKYSSDVRERFISGMCPPCWDNLYAGWDTGDE